jgi:LysR family transcriptional regulator, hypochlorite-specific transcription factor HypT
MRLDWLEDILAVASTGSFSGAAERRRLTQSAFSRRIQQMEEQIGVELFDRSQKPVQLRPTTLAQSAQIEQISAAMRQLVLDLRRGDRMAANRVVIASQHSLTSSLAPEIVRKLQERDESVYVRLRSANLDECLGQVLSRQADIAIVYRTQDEPEDVVEGYLQTVEVGTDRLIPVSAPSFLTELEQARTPRLLPYIDYPADVFFGKVMANKIVSGLGPGWHAIPKAETALTFAALEMAASGVAVAWVPQSLALAQIASGRVVDLSASLPSCPLLIKAVRLYSNHGAAESELWSQLSAMRPSA